MSAPRLFRSAVIGDNSNFTAASGDDLCVCPAGGRFADKALRVSNILRVDLARSAKYADPIAVFQPLLAGAGPSFGALMISLHPSRASTRERYPWVDEDWVDVQVFCTANTAQVGHVDFFKHDQTDLVLFPALNVVSFYQGTGMNDDDRAIEKGHFKRTCAEMLRPVVFVYLTFLGTHEHHGAPIVLKTLIVNFVNGWQRGHNVPQAEWVWGGQCSVVVVYGFYDDVMPFARTFARDHGDRAHCYVAPPDRLPFVSYKDSRWCAVPIVPRESLPHKWAPGAELRWPFYHDAILSAALALGMYLPPYVLLEIVDWLPRMGRNSRVKKISLLEGVASSMRRLGKTPMWAQQE